MATTMTPTRRSKGKPPQPPPDIGDVWHRDGDNARVDVTDTFLRAGAPMVRYLLPGGRAALSTVDAFMAGYHRTMTVEEEAAQRAAAAAEQLDRDALLAAAA